MNKVYAISDTHGYDFDKIRLMLDKVGFDDGDMLYILGDTIDRGDPESMLRFLDFILSHTNVMLIRGNHEQMALDNTIAILLPGHKPCLDEQEYSFRLWMGNGGRPTWDMLMDCSEAERERIIALFADSPLYQEVFIGDMRYILTHSGLGNFDPDKPLEDYQDRELLWNRPMPDSRYYFDDSTRLVFGHTPTVCLDAGRGHEPVIAKTWIDIDCGAAFGGSFYPVILCLNDLSVTTPVDDAEKDAE